MLRSREPIRAQKKTVTTWQHSDDLEAAEISKADKRCTAEPAIAPQQRARNRIPNEFKQHPKAHDDRMIAAVVVYQVKSFSDEFRDIHCRGKPGEDSARRKKTSTASFVSKQQKRKT